MSTFRYSPNKLRDMAAVYTGSNHAEMVAAMLIQAANDCELLSLTQAAWDAQIAYDDTMASYDDDSCDVTYDDVQDAKSKWYELRDELVARTPKEQTK